MKNFKSGQILCCTAKVDDGPWIYVICHFIEKLDKYSSKVRFIGDGSVCAIPTIQLKDSIGVSEVNKDLTKED